MVGHTDRSTGEYHYHHGYKAHQHSNGICPYDYDDKTVHSSGTSTTTQARSFTTTMSNETNTNTTTDIDNNTTNNESSNVPSMVDKLYKKGNV